MIVKIKPLIISLAIPLAVGGLAGLLTSQAQKLYEQTAKPAFSPAPAVFPVVWTLLFILMGISCYLVYMTNMPLKKPALIVYAVQLAVNFCWPIVFFSAQSYLAAFIILCVLWLLVLAMIILFYRVRPLAGWLQIPYILWLTFAAYLNYSVYMLNINP